MHIHEVAKCEPNSTAPNGTEVGNFLSAGGHWDLVAGTTPMTGQLPPLFALQDGTADLTFDTDAFSVDDLLSGAGRSIIVHAGVDNFGSIPSRYTGQGGQTGPDEKTMATGDAGARIACGVIAK
jgi:Cu-Zn family superoxide dismutase